MTQTQTYATHRHFYPMFHFFAAPVLLGVLPIYAIVHLVRYPGLHSAMLLLSALALAALAWSTRTFATRNQDRIILLEERLRFERMPPGPARDAAARLSDTQIIGLRFASDDELAELCTTAAAENLSREAIKRRVKSWRADHRRV